MAPRWVLRTISLEMDGVTLEYVEPKADIRRNGLAVNHVLYVPSGQDYDEEIETLVEAGLDLLRDALEDMAILEAVDPEEEARILLAAQVEQEEEEEESP